jgi:hypothetical protein
VRDPWFRPYLWLPLIGLVALSGCCADTDRDLGHWERALVQEKVGGAEVTVRATLDGKHRAGHMGPEYRWIEATDRYTLRRVDEVKASGATVPVLPHRRVNFTRTLFDESGAQDALAAIESDACVRDGALVFRTVDPGARGKAPGWEILFLRDGFAVLASLGGRAKKCSAAARAAPAWKQWRRDTASGTDLCKRILAGGHLDDGIRCFFRGRAAGRSVVRIVKFKDKKNVDALYRVLEPDASWDGQKWDALQVTAALAATPESRRSAWVERTTTYCADPDHVCAPWRVEAMGRAASSLGEDSCGRLLALAQSQLETEGRGAAERALAIVKGVHACAPSKDTQAFMRGALGRASKKDLKLKSPGQSAYSIVDADCQDRALAPFLDRGTPGSLCQSLPRFAGSWLARHCDAESVAQALGIANEAASPMDPRTDMVLDGALRVLGACDAKAFEQAIDDEPDDSPTVAIADSRGKTKLRAIFVRK